MELYKTKEFAREARKHGVSDTDLCEAVGRAQKGLIDASMGKFLIKQRVSRPSGGRSGGFRTILFYRDGDRAFLHLFAKSDKPDLTASEEEMYRDFARELAPT